MEKQLCVSVVINTYNRAKSLKITLESLFHQTNKNFEVIVVNGPSTDETKEILSKYKEKIKLKSCPVRNLSISRNIGIEASSGDIVAFIDDDAVADTNWINDLIAGYDHADVGGVGGIVYDHTGMQLQYRYSSCDRNGDTDFNILPPFDQYCVPGADKFLYLQGTNCSFRKSCLEKIGGFDEEFEYYLDEVDVCMRIIDLGYKIKPLDHAAVHHKYMKSFLRNEAKVVLHPYSTVKNKYYFAIKNHRKKDSDKVTALLDAWCEEVRNGGKSNYLNHKITQDELNVYLEEVDKACKDGRLKGLQKEKTRRLQVQDKKSFLPFPIVERKEKPLKICYLSKEYPPENFGGIGRYTYDLATIFASKGHEVHVITEGTVQDRVDFEDGVWVHRLVSKLYEPFAGMVLGWNFSLQARNYFELERINEQGSIDIVHGPVWLCESGMANCSNKYPTLLTLMTTQKILNHLTGEPDQGSHEYKLMKLEEIDIQQHENIHAISHSILDNCRKSMQNDVNVFISPLGCRDLSSKFKVKKNEKKTVIYTVGRQEHRKGIDLLLEAAENILSNAKYKDVYFVIAGKETTNTLTGKTYKEDFVQRNKNNTGILDHVKFLGEISEDELMQNYADADITCIPSRYESFGIVLLEGMSFSNAVVASYTGGMRDIIKDGVTGLFFESDNAADLAVKLKRFLDDTQYRKKSAQAARKEYLEVYSLEAVYQSLYKKYCEIAAAFFPKKENSFDQVQFAKMIAYAEECKTQLAEKSINELLCQHRECNISAIVLEDANISFGFKILRQIYRIIRKMFPSFAVKIRSRWLFTLCKYRESGIKGIVKECLIKVYHFLTVVPVLGCMIRYLINICLLPLRMEKITDITIQLMNHDELLKQIGNMENTTWDILKGLRTEMIQLNQQEAERIYQEVCDNQNKAVHMMIQFQNYMSAEEKKLEAALVQDCQDTTEKIYKFVSEIQKEDHYYMENYSNCVIDRINQRLMDVRSENLFELLRKEEIEDINKKEVECKIINKEKVETARSKNEIQLNVGAGHICFDEYINVDERAIRNIDITADVRKLPFDKNSVDEIYASHLIEHFTKNELEKVLLPYWCSLLKSGGKIRVILPDLESMIFHYMEEEYSINDLREVVYGLQEYPGDIHYALYGKSELKQIFENSGLTAQYVFDGRRNGKCYDMELDGIKQ